ncbi:YybH family protein [Pseudonocardia dioxanivorans]|uniref:YybH family protein n=1 Tax=Pseudonocardia dioxanivorans TaxID=240495 RepID=UPI000CD1DB43|nr:nuclear transport factor 2 family protein [Pseudonocardia dioxanivorans]
MELDEDFRAALERVRRAVNDFVNGDPEPYKACWHHQGRVSIFGGLGAYEAGWDEVGPRLEWVAAGFVTGYVEEEVLSAGCSGDLGFTVCLERGRQQVAGRDTDAPVVLRVTQVYERVDGVWGLVHRHADPLTDKGGATAILAGGGHAAGPGPAG